MCAYHESTNFISDPTDVDISILSTIALCDYLISEDLLSWLHIPSFDRNHLFQPNQ